MSIWNYVFDNEYRQRSDIENLKRRSQATGRSQSRKAKELDRRVEELEEELGEITLVCRSLLTVLRQSGAVDPAALEAVMADIDAEDGVIDGRVTPEDKRPKPRKAPKAPARRRSKR